MLYAVGSNLVEREALQRIPRGMSLIRERRLGVEDRWELSFPWRTFFP